MDLGRWTPLRALPPREATVGGGGGIGTFGQMDAPVCAGLPRVPQQANDAAERRAKARKRPCISPRTFPQPG